MHISNRFVTGFFSHNVIKYFLIHSFGRILLCLCAMPLGGNEIAPCERYDFCFEVEYVKCANTDCVWNNWHYSPKTVNYTHTHTPVAVVWTLPSLTHTHAKRQRNPFTKTLESYIKHAHTQMRARMAHSSDQMQDLRVSSLAESGSLTSTNCLY